MASSTNAMRKRSAQHGATQHSAAVRMACGDCCLPACYVKERAGQAIAKDFDISMSGECALVECTSARCDQAGRLHKECYDRLERDLIARVTSAASRTTEAMSKGDWNKIIWSTGSQGKYNVLRKHCGCACGHGTFIPLLGASGQVQLRSGAADATGGEPVDSAEERRRLIEAKLARQRELHEARARDEKDQRARERATAAARKNERQGRPAEPPLGSGQQQTGLDERGKPLWARLPGRRGGERASTASEEGGACVRVRTLALHD